MSSKSLDTFEKPCPFKSNAIKVPKCLTYWASKAKLRAEWPAPCIQKNIAPFEPALNNEVPYIKILFTFSRYVS